ncbi:methyltransferase domain-containing protein [Pilimelia columellifera]|uniref:Methyltransferase n=1 Tax=Pilimelia columellifera subsp. columellifera TaxID=706583 RepID=A0ABN3N9W2_9ACTN
MEHQPLGPDATAPTAATPRTAVVWAALRAELARSAGRELSIVDVGGGTGGFAVPLAQAGHRVSVVDANPDALAALNRRAAEAGVADRVSAVQADADDLGAVAAAGSVDLVLCHAVLEVVDDPAAVVAGMVAALRPGGAASVIVANRAAAVLSRMINGQLGPARAALAEPSGPGRAPAPRRYDVTTATDLLSAAGLRVEQAHGIRVFVDLTPAAVAEADPQALTELELAVCDRAPYRDIAAQLHLLARASG